ncbi:MAG: 4Fe-4S binding protein [Solobacterium sp.]|nr:4Fe-4S binding protein [Solobacterium sp.]
MSVAGSSVEIKFDSCVHCGYCIEFCPTGS